jgi:hypothetical protein
VASKPWSGRETDRAYLESLTERRQLRADVEGLRRDVWIDRAILAVVAFGVFGKAALAVFGLVLPFP